MKYIVYIVFLLLSISLKSQQRFPTGFPTQFNSGWNKWGYVQSDSGLIVANRDTTWLAKYSGTIVFRPNNKKFYYFDSTTLRWNELMPSAIDTTALSNRINLKLNISDTASMLLPYLRKADTLNKWVQNVYARNDSLFKLKNGSETFIHTFATSGAGTVTSVGLSVPAAFTVSGSPITTSGTFSLSGAGTSAQYIKGNGTLGTFDTAAIPNFFLKVRGLLSGTSPINYNTTTGAISINDANITGTKGAATFTSSFQDNGSGQIDLATLVSAGSCSGCTLNIDAKGRVTSYSTGAGGATDNVNIGSGFRILNATTQEMRTLFSGFGSNIDSVTNTNGITWSADTTRGTGLPTQYYVDSSVSANLITSDNGLTKTGNNIKIGGTLIDAVTDIDNSGNSFILHGTGSNVLRSVNGTIQYNVSTSSVSAQMIATNSSTNKFSEVDAVEGSAYLVGGKNGVFYNQINVDSDKVFLTTKFNTTPHKLILDTLGRVKVDAYTGTNFQTIDTSYNALVVDASGNVYKRAGDGGGGGGGSVSSSNGILNNSSVIQLGDISTTTSAVLTATRYLRSGNNPIYFQGNKTDGGNPNMVFDDTLVASAGTPRSKNWIQFNSFNHSAPNFYMGSDLVEDGTGHFNQIFNMGQNLSAVGTRVNANYGAFGWSMEGSYQGLQEWHQFWIDKHDKQYRLSSFTIDTAAKDIDYFNTVSRHYWKRPSDNQLFATLQPVNGGAQLRLQTATNFLGLLIDSIQNSAFLTANSTLDNFYLSNFTNWSFPGLGFANQAYSFTTTGSDPVSIFSKSGETSKSSICSIAGDIFLTSNAYFGAGTWLPFNTAKPAWSIYASNTTDAVAIIRGPAGGGPVGWTYPFYLNARGLGINNTSPQFGLDINRTVGIAKDSLPIITSLTSQYVVVVDTTNNKLKRIALGGLGNTIYTGDGTLAGNRTVTGSNNNLTFATIGNYRINANTFVYSTNSGTFPYTAAIVGADDHYEIGYTPTPGTFSKGAALVIDTNNNASLGTTQMPSTAPLYSTGGMTYVSGLENQAGTFNPVATLTSGTTTIPLTYYFIQCDATSGNVIINLPSASAAFAGTIGIKYIFYRVDNSGNTVTINRAGSDTINGTTSFTLTAQYQTKQLQCISTSTWAQY